MKHRLFLKSALFSLALWFLCGQVRAGEVLFTFGEMMQLKNLPLQSAERVLSEEEIVLYQNFEFYAYTVFENLGSSPTLLLLDEGGIVRWHSELTQTPPQGADVSDPVQYTIIEAVKFALNDL